MIQQEELSSLYLSWLIGDGTAPYPLQDYCEENGVNLHPFEVGKCYFIEQQTLYYVGRVTRVGPCWIEMEDCSWVHWTGRKSTLFAAKSFCHKDFGSDRKPRTEYEGTKIIFTTSTSAANLWEGPLPKQSIQ